MKDTEKSRGSITVFLSLILLILISMIAQVMQEAVFQADRIKLASAMDISLNAVLGEYGKELVEEYGLFFVDTSDDNGVFDKEVIASRLDYYMYRNIQEQSGMLQMELYDTKIKEVVLATDNNGTAFVKEAVKAYKETMAVNAVQTALQKLKDYEQAQSSRKTLEKNQVKPSDLEVPDDIEVNREEKEKAETIVNPVEIIEELKTNMLLGIVASDLDISSNVMDLSDTLEKRKLQKGDSKKQEDISVSDKVIFDLYLKEQFSCFGNQKKEDNSGCLRYEMEYLISGKESDRKNLNTALEKIIFIREGINFVYLLSDSAKMAQAEALASALVGYTGMAPLIIAMKFAILAVWAYGESLLEVRILLTGGKVDFLKNNENWKLDLKNLESVASIVKGEAKGDEQGMAYEDYLWLLLSVCSQKDKCFRSMDLIEKNIQHITEGISFRMDCCVAYLKAEASCVSRGGRSITVLKGMGF